MPFTPHSKKINREVANFSYKQRPVVCSELLAFLIYQASPLPSRELCSPETIHGAEGEKPRTNDPGAESSWNLPQPCSMGAGWGSMLGEKSNDISFQDSLGS